MHILYAHQNYPAQFGHLAHALVHAKKWRCTFISNAPAAVHDGVENICYTLGGGATRNTHFCSRTFENAVWHCDAIYKALADRPDLEPDLIVGHSGFGSTLFLRELYPRVPVVNLFEFFYRPHEPQSDIDFRKDRAFPLEPRTFLRARCRNAMMMLDLNNCQLGYSPTHFQRTRFPAEFQHKLRTVFDGIDRSIYHGQEDRLRPPTAGRQPREIAGITVGDKARIVTYVSRGFESMRGFDIFMRSAKIIARQNPHAEFFIVGSDKISYGGDGDHLGEHKTFKDWVLAQEEYDLARFHFLGLLPRHELADLMAASDLHIYLTVPFVLSWSMLDAMSCGAVVLASATAPVQEIIRHGHNGLLADFFSPDDFAAKALEVLENPDEFRPLGKAAEAMIAEKYSLEAILPQMVRIYIEAATRMGGSETGAVPAPITMEQLDDVFTLTKSQKRSPFRG